MTMIDFEGYIQVDKLIGPEEKETAGVITAPTFYSMANYSFGAVIVTATLTQDKTAIAQLRTAVNSSGGTPADVAGKTVTLTGGSGGSVECKAIYFNEFDITGSISGAVNPTDLYVGVVVTTNQNADLVAAVLVRGGGREQV